MVVQARHLLREAAASGAAHDAVMRDCAAILRDALEIDAVLIRVAAPGANQVELALKPVFTDAAAVQPLVNEPQLVLEAGAVTLVVNDCERSAISPELQQEMRTRGVRSFALALIESSGSPLGTIECHSYGMFRRWTREETELLAGCADLLSVRLALAARSARAGVPMLQTPTTAHEYHRLAKHGSMIIVRTDRDFEAQEVLGDTERILGVSREELQKESDIWRRFVHDSDLRRLLLAAANAGDGSDAVLNEEIRVINERDGTTHWLLMRAVPFSRPDAGEAGWEGFGIDITGEKQAQELLINEQQRLAALFEISQSLPLLSDPAKVMLRALDALMRAVGAEAGAGSLREPENDTIEIVASRGFSEEEVRSIASEFNASPLGESIFAAGEAVTLSIEESPEQVMRDWHASGWKRLLAVPLTVDGRALGCFVLAGRRISAFDRGDSELASIVAQQVALSVRAALQMQEEQLQSRALAALYELTHEVSKHLTAKEVAEHAFPIIQRELGCKRMWLGVMNEQGTRLMGQAGLGPGLRQQIIDVQVELDLRHDFLDEAIRTQHPVVVAAGKKMECSGLNKIMKRLQIGGMVIVPLVTLGQVVGVLVVEPQYPAAFFAQRRLQLLTRMGAELATVIMARRFEQRMSESNKMRMAGLLASGVAHNFNNLLQAIMGQASLLELQLPRESALLGSARMIVAAARRGAGLIKQLLNFSMPNVFRPVGMSIPQLLLDSKEMYRSVLGPDVELVIRAPALDLPAAKADPTLMQQVLTNLLMNAREALAGKRGGLVTLNVQQVRLFSGEVSPDLAPGHYLRVDIEDNGRGMSAEVAARCFEPFFSTKRSDDATGVSPEGFGLGLSSAYAIMKQHEGIVTVSSTPGDGSTFSLYLPVFQAARAESEATASQEPPRVYLGALEDGLEYGLRSALQAHRIHAEPCDDPRKLEESLRFIEGAKVVLVATREWFSRGGSSGMRGLPRDRILKVIVLGESQETLNKIAAGLPHTFIGKRGAVSAHELNSLIMELVSNAKLPDAPAGQWREDNAEQSAPRPEQQGDRGQER